MRRKKSDRAQALHLAILLILTTSLSGCLLLSGLSKHKGSNGDGPKPETPSFPNSDSDRFISARNLLSSRCSTCHSHNHTPFQSYTEQQWAQLGLISPGLPEESLLLGYIRNSGVTGPGTMPEGDSITEQEILILREWIIRIGETPMGTPTLVTPAPLFASERTRAALAVIRNNCSKCHDTVGSHLRATSQEYRGTLVPAFSLFTSDVEFSTNGMVEYGRPANSWLIRALRSFNDLEGEPPAPEAPLSKEDRRTIEDWVTKMGTP